MVGFEIIGYILMMGIIKLLSTFVIELIWQERDDNEPYHWDKKKTSKKGRLKK